MSCETHCLTRQHITSFAICSNYIQKWHFQYIETCLCRIGVCKSVGSQYLGHCFQLFNASLCSLQQLSLTILMLWLQRLSCSLLQCDREKEFWIGWTTKEFLKFLSWLSTFIEDTPKTHNVRATLMQPVGFNAHQQSQFQDWVPILYVLGNPVCVYQSDSWWQ